MRHRSCFATGLSQGSSDVRSKLKKDVESEAIRTARVPSLLESRVNQFAQVFQLFRRD
jgi:hypothetical protein